MRESQRSTHATSPIVRPAKADASLREMLRRGEIGGQALGLIQIMAARGEPGQAGIVCPDPSPRRCEWEAN